MPAVFKGYRPNNVSVGRFLLSKRVERVSKAASKDIAGLAGEFARRNARTGRLAGGYKTETTVGGAGLTGGPRKVGVVYNDVPYAAVDELGNGKRKATHNLENAGRFFHVKRGLR